MKEKTKRILLFCTLGLIIVFGILYWSSKQKKTQLREIEPVSEIQESIVEPRITEESSRTIGVHVTGAVMYPDQVYFMPEGSRVADAINQAGGAIEGADLSLLNLAAYLKDGQRIRVPFAGESMPVGEGEIMEQTKHLTNINSASKIELMQLPGIGETTADRILAYREEHGGFSSVEELMNVSGIGQSKFDAIKDLISVDDMYEGDGYGNKSAGSG